jgi:hypothetical protein
MATTKKPTTKKPATSTGKTLADKATDAVKMPISFEQFVKNPVLGVAFVCLIGIGYVYIDLKKGNDKRDTSCETDKRDCKETIEKKDSIILKLATQNAIIEATKK